MLNTFNNFRRPIDEVELNRAKNMLKRSILNNLSHQGDRLEETARGVNLLFTFLVLILRKSCK